MWRSGSYEVTTVAGYGPDDSPGVAVDLSTPRHGLARAEIPLQDPFTPSRTNPPDPLLAPPRRCHRSDGATRRCRAASASTAWWRPR